MISTRWIQCLYEDNLRITLASALNQRHLTIVSDPDARCSSAPSLRRINPSLLSPVNAWFGAPLIAQNGERLHDPVGQAQHVHQNGAVKVLAHVIAIRLVCRQEFPFLETLKDVRSLGALILVKRARVQDGQLW